MILYFPKNKMILFEENGKEIKNEREKGEAYWMFEIGNFMKDDHKDRVKKHANIIV